MCEGFGGPRDIKQGKECIPLTWDLCGCSCARNDGLEGKSEKKDAVRLGIS